MNFLLTVTEWSCCSLEVDSLGNFRDVTVGEGAAGVEVMATLALHPAHQLAHVCRVAVFRGHAGQTRRPDESDEVPLRVCDVVPGLEGEELADELGQAVRGDRAQYLLFTARHYRDISRRVCCARGLLQRTPAAQLIDHVESCLREQEHEEQHRQQPAPLQHYAGHHHHHHDTRPLVAHRRCVDFTGTMLRYLL